jgi:hypothetical protein
VPATAADITPPPREREVKRRGRTTGQTGAIHRNPPPLAEGEDPQEAAHEGDISDDPDG